MTYYVRVSKSLPPVRSTIVGDIGQIHKCSSRCNANSAGRPSYAVGSSPYAMHISVCAGIHCFATKRI